MCIGGFGGYKNMDPSRGLKGGLNCRAHKTTPKKRYNIKIRLEGSAGSSPSKYRTKQISFKQTLFYKHLI